MPNYSYECNRREEENQFLEHIIPKVLSNETNFSSATKEKSKLLEKARVKELLLNGVLKSVLIVVAWLTEITNLLILLG